MRRGTWINLGRLLVGAATLALLVFAASTVLSLVRPGARPAGRQLPESTARLERPTEPLPEVIGWHDPSSTWSASLSFQRAGHRAASQLLRFRAVEMRVAGAMTSLADDLAHRIEKGTPDVRLGSVLDLVDLWEGGSRLSWERLSGDQVDAIFCDDATRRQLSDELERRQDNGSGELAEWCHRQLDQRVREAWIKALDRFAMCVPEGLKLRDSSLAAWLRLWPPSESHVELGALVAETQGIKPPSDRDLALARIRDVIDARLRDDDADAQLALVGFVVDHEDEFAGTPSYVESLCRQYRTVATERVAASLARDFGSQESRMAARILLRGSEPAPDDSQGWRWWLAANWCRHSDTMPDDSRFMSRIPGLPDTLKIDQLVMVMRPEQLSGIELSPQYERLRNFVQGTNAADPELAQVWFPPTTAHGEAGWIKLGDYVDRSVVVANLPAPGRRARDPLELLGLLIAAYAPGLDDYEMTPPDEPMRDRLLASVLWTLDIDQVAWWAALELWAGHHEASGGTVSDLARAAGLNQESGNQR